MCNFVIDPSTHASLPSLGMCILNNYTPKRAKTTRDAKRILMCVMTCVRSDGYQLSLADVTAHGPEMAQMPGHSGR
jgi:hypothetical protein